MTAARPAAAAIVQKKMPRLIPSAAACAAARPWRSAFFVTSAMSTPGVITRIAETARNGNTCTHSIVPVSELPDAASLPLGHRHAMEPFKGKYLSLTSFKRDGTGVATPVWFVAENGHLLVETDAD